MLNPYIDRLFPIDLYDYFDYEYALETPMQFDLLSKFGDVFHTWLYKWWCMKFLLLILHYYLANNSVFAIRKGFFLIINGFVCGISGVFFDKLWIFEK